MLQGLRKKYAEPAKKWARISLWIALLTGLGAAMWLAIGFDEGKRGYVIGGCVFGAICLGTLTAAALTRRRAGRIGRMDGRANLFREDVLAGRKKLIAIESVLPAIRRELTRLHPVADGAERARLEAILDRIAEVIPRSEWDTYQTIRPVGGGRKPWQRKD